jgi:maltooligosyltrehalose trehalohydrolase
MLFQGQEFCANSPWYYFADHEPKLAAQVLKGRRQFMSQFTRMNNEEGLDIPDPGAGETFRKCVIDWNDKERNPAGFRFHKELLKLRREDPVLSAQKHKGVDGAVLFIDAFVLRFFGEEGDDRLLIINLGKDLRLAAIPEPLLAPPAGKYWDLKFSSEEPEYGGTGVPVYGEEEQWLLPSESAIFMAPEPRSEKKKETK